MGGAWRRANIELGYLCCCSCSLFVSTPRRYVRTLAYLLMASALVICTKAVWVTAGWLLPSPAWPQSRHYGRRCCTCALSLSPLCAIRVSFSTSPFLLLPGDPWSHRSGVESEASWPVCRNFSFPVLEAGPLDGCRRGRPFAGQWGWSAALLPLSNTTGVLERPVGEGLRQVRFPGTQNALILDIYISKQCCAITCPYNDSAT